MECARVSEKLPDLMADSLDDVSRTAMEAHWKTCPSCREEAESLQRVWRDLGTIGVEAPSPAGRVRFDAMVEAYREGLSQGKAASGWQESLNEWIARWWPRQPLVQVGASLGLLVLGLLAGSLLVSPPPEGGAGLRSLEAEVRDLRQLVAMSMLEQRSASQRLRGISWSSRIEQPDGEVLATLIDTLNYDPSVNVRLAAVDALARFAEAPIVRQGIVESLPRQRSPLVQISLIDLLVGLGERRSIAILETLEQDPSLHETVRERARQGLAELG